MGSISGEENLFVQQEAKISGRVGHIAYPRLWMDDEKNPVTIKYAFKEHEDVSVSDSTKQRYEGQVEKWSEGTCLKFKKTPLKENIRNGYDLDQWCGTNIQNKTEKVMLIIESRGGRAHFGIDNPDTICEYFNYVSTESFEFYNQIMFAWTLGFLDTIAQPDFYDHMRINFENFSPQRSSRTLIFMMFRCKGKAIPLPIPFDYMSVLMPHSNWFGDVETKPTVVALDPSQQYLIDYRKVGHLPASFFDIMSANILYKCIPKWKSLCKESAREIPKCKNFGYVSRDCTCICPPSYSGVTCESKTGDNVPYPTQDGAFVIKIVDDKNYDLGELLPIRTASVPGAYIDLEHSVFLNIKILPKDPKRLPTIKVYVPFERVRRLIDDQIKSEYIETIEDVDCKRGMRLLWGSRNRDGRRLFCDCSSTFLRNEPLENARVIRGREPDMTVTLVNSFGASFQNPELTVETSKLQLLTEFLPPPKTLTHKQNRTSPPVTEGTDDGTGDGTVTGTEITSTEIGDDTAVTAAAMTAVGGGVPAAAAVGAAAGLSLLILLCFLVFFLKRRKKKKLEELDESGEDDSGSESGSGDD